MRMPSATWCGPGPGRSEILEDRACAFQLESGRVVVAYPTAGQSDQDARACCLVRRLELLPGAERAAQLGQSPRASPWARATAPSAWAAVALTRSLA